MTLQNLLGSSLEAIEPDAANIQRLLEAAQRNLEDAQLAALSNENRFDAAYKAIMQLANLSLQAEGYRTLTSTPGHHRTMIQLLTKTVGLDSETMILLDALRKQRNVADYSGDPVPNSAVDECFRRAVALDAQVREWLNLEHPDLLK